MAPLPVPSGTAFRLTLANVLGRALPNGATTVGSSAGVSGRMASKQQKAQPQSQPSDRGDAPAATTPPVVAKPAPLQDASNAPASEHPATGEQCGRWELGSGPDATTSNASGSTEAATDSGANAAGSRPNAATTGRDAESEDLPPAWSANGQDASGCKVAAQPGAIAGQDSTPANQWTPMTGPVDGTAATAVAPRPSGAAQQAGAASTQPQTGAVMAAQQPEVPSSAEQAGPATHQAGAPDATPQAAATLVGQAVAELAGAPVQFLAAGAPMAGMPTAGATSGKGDSSSTAGKVATKNAGDAASATSFDPASAGNAKGSKGAEAPGAASDGSSHEAQSNGQPTQHTQADPAQTSTVTAKTIDGGASPAQTVPAHAVARDAATPARTPDALGDSARQSLQRGDSVPSPLDGEDSTPASGINAAKLMQTMGETEMRVGMRSSEFGDISIRTSVTPQQMLAQISLDHGDLSQAIAAHVGAMQSKLGEESGLPTVIEVNRSGNQFADQSLNHAGAPASGDSGQSPQREQRGFVRSARTESATVPTEADVGLGPAPLVSGSNGYRLDIRA